MSEYNEEVVVNITADFSDIQSGVTKLVDSASALPESFKETRTNVDAIVELIRNEMGAMNSGMFANIPSQFKYAFELAFNQIKPQILEINKMLQSGLTDIDVAPQINQQLGFLAANLDRVVTTAKSLNSLTANLNNSQIKALNQDTPDIQRSIYRIVNTLSKHGSVREDAIRRALFATPGAERGLSAIAAYTGWSKSQQDDFMKAMVKLSAPSYSRKEYYDFARKYAGGRLPKAENYYEYNSYKDRLPDRFKTLPIDHKKLEEAESNMQEIYNQYISQSEHKIVLDLAKRNEVFRQSLIKAGAGAYRTTKKYGAGSFMIPKNITRLQLAQAEGFLFYDQLKTAWEGDPVHYKSLASKAAQDQQALANSSSKTVIESLVALHALESINQNVSPVYREGVNIKPYNGKSGVYAGSLSSVRKPRYMVMSLTPEDFFKGAIPSSEKIEDRTGKFHKDILGGGSKYILLNQSLYTDLAGLYGHNTPGNGIRGSVAKNPEMVSNSPMLILDYSAHMFEKDSDGNIIWENNTPKPNENTMKQLERIFSRDSGSAIQYTYNGQAQQYAYPIVSRTVDKKEQRYVPTNIKGGGVYLLPENEYIAKSKASLEQFGVNVFDNFADLNAKYDFFEDANKTIEATNRMLTPSIPFTQLGGVNPDSSKVAFVKMKSAFKHDGSMFFMPGYIPGQDAVVRAPGIKGVAQTVDFKKLIRDVYGLQDGDPFILPGLNIPEALEKLYTETPGSLDAIRSNPEWGQSAIDKYFIDIMSKDVLIPESVVKTPLYRGLSSDQAASMMSRVHDIFGGFRSVATANEHFSKNQTSLSKQVVQNLILTAEELDANSKAWDQYIYRLQNDVETQKQHVFNQENNPLDVAFRDNPSLITVNRLMQTRLRNTIEAAKQDQREGRLFAKDQLSMRLALANPGEWILAAGQKAGLSVKDQQLANTLALAENIVGASGYGTHTGINTTVGGNRYPNTPNEQYPLTISGAYSDLIRKYNLSSYGVYVNADTIGNMGGGDVDGDTIQFIIGEIAEKAYRRTKETRGNQLPNVDRNKAEPLPMPTDDSQIHAKQYAEMLYRQIVAPIHMGRTSNAIDALSQGNWDDEAWLKAVGYGAVDLRAKYDIDSTFAKTGILGEWSKAALNAERMGKPFVGVYKDLAGALTAGDFDKMQSIADYNYPSIYSNATMLSLASLQRMPMSEENIQKFIAAQRLKTGILQDLTTSNQESPEYYRAQYYDKSISAFADILRRGSVLSTDSWNEQDAYLNMWHASVSHILETMGSVEGALPEGRRAELLKQINEINRQRQKLKNANVFGLTEQAVIDRKGYAANGFFDNFTLTGKFGSYQTAVNEVEDANDLKNLHMIAAMSVNPVLTEAAKKQALQLDVNKAVSMIDGGKNPNRFNKHGAPVDWKFSYSMLKDFGENPAKWFNRWILGNEEYNTHASVGTALHEAVQLWANSRIANQNDNSLPIATADQLNKMFSDTILGDERSGVTLNEDGVLTHIDPKIDSKLKSMHSFLNKLPSKYLDEDILAAEYSITMPWLGNQIQNPNEAVPTYGAIDLVTRKRKSGEKPGKATGEVINTDWKPYADNQDHDQFLLYAKGVPQNDIGAPFSSKYRIVGYVDDSERTYDVDDKAALKAQEKYQGYVKGIQGLALSTGFNWELANPHPDLERRRQEEAEYKASLMKPKQHDGDLTIAQKQAYAKQAEEMAKSTGQGMAIAMALQSDITGYEEQLRKMQSQLASKTKKKEDGLYNPWVGYQYALDQGYYQRAKEFEARKADPVQMANLSQAYRDAQDQYNESLRVAAVKDIQDLNKALTEEMSAADGKTAVTQYSKQFEELTERINEAQQAYLVLKEKTKKDALDESALKNAEQEYEKLQETRKAREAQIRAKSTEAFNADASAMHDIANLGELSADSRIEKQVRELRMRRENNILQANDDFNKKLIDQTERNRRVKAMEDIDVDAYEQRLYREMYEGSNQRYSSQIQAMSRSVEHNDYFSRLVHQSEDLRLKIDSLRTQMSQDLKLGKIKQSDYDNNISKLNELEKATSALHLGFNQLEKEAARSFAQFGRKLFHQAIEETKRFVVEFDNAMTEIQMVTLKTDDEISVLGDGLIDKAVDLKVSVGEITSAATSLYRQGLNDDQVDERLVDVTKFAKTAKVETADAIKLITVALNSEMVDSSEEAMDVISALSDSAATEAAQITKGLQKSLAAAKEVGVSYKELVAMLTVITSKTQLGGSVAGTTMRNILSRLTRVGSSEMIIDESGAAISGSQQARVLSSIGVETYRKQDGSIDAYDILSQIGLVWNGLSDAKRNQVVYALGGAEQFSNVAALMQGFAETDENGNNLLQQYIAIAEGSDGVTDKKYANYVDSLTASMEGFRSSFDAFADSVTESDFVIKFFDYLSSSVSGITKLNEALFKIPSALAMIGAGALAITVLTPGLREALLVIAALSGVGYAIGKISEANKPISTSQVRINKLNAYEDVSSMANDAYQKAYEYNERQRNGETLSDSEMSDYKQSLFDLKMLGHISNDASNGINELAESAADAAGVIADAKGNIETANKYEASKLAFEAAKDIDQNNQQQIKEYNQEYSEKISNENYLGAMEAIAYKRNETSIDPGYFAANSYMKIFDFLNNEGVLDDTYVTRSAKVPTGNKKLWWDEYEWRDFNDLQWRDIDEKDRYKYAFDPAVIDVIYNVINNREKDSYYAQMMQTADDPEFDYNGNLEILKSLINEATFPELAESGMYDSVMQIILNQMRKEFEDDYENFSASNFMSENLTEDVGNGIRIVTSQAMLKYAEKVAPEAFQIAQNKAIPINAMAISADTAATLNKSSEDTTAVKLLEFLQSATGESIEEKLNNFAAEAVKIKNWDDYIAHKDNADLAAAISEMFDFEEDGTPKLKREVSESEIQTLESLLASKVPRLFMESYRSEATIRKEALDNYDYIMQKNTSKDRASAFANLSTVNATNEQLQQELKDMLGEDLLNLILSGIADDETIAYAENVLRYGGTQESELSYRDHAMTSLFGVGYRDGLTEEEMNAAALQYEAMMYDPLGSLQLDKIRELEGGVDLLEELSKILDGTSEDAERCGEALQQVVDGIGSEEVSQLLKYDRAQQRVADTFQALADGGEDAANAYSQLLSESKSLSSASWAIDQYKSGSRDDKVIDILGDFGVDQQMLKKAAGKDADAAIEIIEMTYEDRFRILQENFSQNFGDITAYVDEFENKKDMRIIDAGIFNVNGSVNVSALLKAFSEAGVIVDQTWAAVVQAMASAATFSITADGDEVKLDLSKINSSGKNYYGGGSGGTKKTSGDKLIERLGYGRDLYEHQIQMVQYEQTRYQNADELGNYGKLIEEEIAIEKDYLPVLESNIAALRDEFETVDEGSEDWYKLRDAILDAEEQYAEINNTIDENEKKLEENQQAILKLHTDLEQMVVEEIELRIESEKEMLDGSVSMQDIILNAVKQRYQDEWDLIKKDIDKKKEALEEEKSLIDERLDARREAEDEAAQYEELAELKKQLALVSMDSTRTKDAASLRESIAELEKEIGWSIAEKEAENEKDAIQDQIDAYDDYVTKGDEDLEELLSDANNFAEEVNGVLKLSQNELFEWLKTNVQEYANSLDDAQKQMVQSWEATYKQMLGITDTYWDEVNAILSAKDTFLEYMKQSKEYIYASEDERKQLLYQWSDSYDKWKLAQKQDADYEHTDSGLGDWSGSEYTGDSSSSGGSGSSGGSSNQSDKVIQSASGPNAADIGPYRVYANGKTYGPYENFSTAYNEMQYWGNRGYSATIYDGSNNVVGQVSSKSSLDQNLDKYTPVNNNSLENGNKDDGHWKYLVTVNGDVKQTGYGHTSRKDAQEAAKEWIKKKGLSGAKYSTYYYAKGGIADFTGLAWLDGTPEEPERILSAEQTKSFDSLVDILDDLRSAGIDASVLREMVDWSSFVKIPNFVPYVGNESFSNSIANIGDIHVVVNEAVINDDMDLDNLASVVGEKFAKEISKQGFNIAKYNF